MGNKDGEMNEKELLEYREKVKKYTSYRIGLKMSANTEAYTKKEIENGQFKVKHTAVLRILTKWIQEL